jgi:hypothetical protein
MRRAAQLCRCCDAAKMAFVTPADHCRRFCLEPAAKNGLSPDRRSKKAGFFLPYAAKTTVTAVDDFEVRICVTSRQLAQNRLARAAMETPLFRSDRISR